MLACAILITDSEPLVPAVIAALTRQLGDLPRAEIASQALRDHGAAVLVDDVAAMVAAVNAYAPEHVELLLADADAVAPQIATAGAIFVGAFTPEAAGDYTAGPSHVLPTAGAARFASPLGVWTSSSTPACCGSAATRWPPRRRRSRAWPEPRARGPRTRGGAAGCAKRHSFSDMTRRTCS